MVSGIWFRAIVAVIGAWFVGVSSLAALWRHDPAVLALLLLPASIVAALLVVAFIWQAAWHDVSGTAAAAPGSAASERGADDLDDVLSQSLPAIDPPSLPTGIAGVLPVSAG